MASAYSSITAACIGRFSCSGIGITHCGIKRLVASATTSCPTAAAQFYGVAQADIQKAVASFEGVRRRQEVRGTVRGITIIDDFGHHPTALQQTLRALRHQYPGRRIWAVFEPRSNTTRRAIFQKALPEALAEADGVLLSQVARLDQLPEDNRLDPQQVVADIAALGKPAFYEAGVPEILDRLKHLSKEGDVIAIFSNGGFDNIHKRLIETLSPSPAA